MPARAQERVEAYLAVGDTGAAIRELRTLVARGGSSEQWCKLGTLLSRTSTNQDRSAMLRYEAQQALERGLSMRSDPACLYELALLREKQGMRTESTRLLHRLDRQLQEHPELATREFAAELLYRRALLADDWLRNFDHLVAPPSLPVTDPACHLTTFFCENFRRPRDFNTRLAEAQTLSGLIVEQRLAVVRLLDTALALAPRHGEGQRLRLRRALVEQDWQDFEGVARNAVAADGRAVFAWLALLAAQNQRGALQEAAGALAIVDSLLPDSTRGGYERLATIGGSGNAAQPRATWALSDPLFLTSANERRVSHYARLALADIAFSDPMTGALGRDTPPGRLVLRYGWPRHIWEVRRDARLELTPGDLAVAREILNCAALLGPTCVATAERSGPMHSVEGGGRWTFFNYDLDAPSFIMERALSDRTYEYKVFTLTEELDSAWGRAARSSYESPYGPGTVRALITRFPRPVAPAIETHATFAWDSTLLRSDSVTVGVFVHDRTSGAEVNRAVSGRGGRRGSTEFGGTVRVRWGELQVSIEGFAAGAQAAGQLRERVTMAPTHTTLSVSDVLLGDSASGPEFVTRREDVRFSARSDRTYAPGSTVALYWEIYRSPARVPTTDTAVSVPLNVQLTVRDAGGRSTAANLMRGVAQLLGVQRTRDQSLAWTVERPAPALLSPQLLLMGAPEEPGLYTISIMVTEPGTSRTATTERVIRVTR